MADSKKLSPIEQSRAQRAEARRHLVIDKDDLSECLIRQPESYYHVADAHAMMVAERDSAKLDLEEAEAAEAKKIRALAAANDEKLTEAGLRQELTLSARLQGLNNKLLELSAEVNAWAAMRDAFQQRSYMLRELVGMYLTRISGSGTGMVSDLSDRNRAAAGEERRRRRLSK